MKIFPIAKIYCRGCGSNKLCLALPFLFPLSLSAQALLLFLYT